MKTMKYFPVLKNAWKHACAAPDALFDTPQTGTIFTFLRQLALPHGLFNRQAERTLAFSTVSRPRCMTVARSPTGNNFGTTFRAVSKTCRLTPILRC